MQKVPDSPSTHIDIARLVAFLIDEKPLSSEEYEHLLQCAHCRNETIHAASEELNRRNGN
jgi:hypothetical protein